MEQFYALIGAIERHEPIDEWLQDEHRGLLSMGDSIGWTPLIWAAFNGWTPLGFAAYSGNAEAAALLLIDPMRHVARLAMLGRRSRVRADD